MPNRLVREGLMESERVLSLPVEARWLFVIILLSADDVGLFEATEFKLARRADVNRDLASKLLQMIGDADLVRFYLVDGKRFGFIPRFRQRIQIKRARHPLPPESLLTDDQDALSKIKHLASDPSDAHLMSNGCTTDGQPSEPEPEPEPEKEKKRSDAAHPRRQRKAAARPLTNFKTWIEAVKATGDRPVPDGDEVFAYAQDVGLPREFLALAWSEFRHRYTAEHASKRYRDWRLVFRKAVRENWLKLWWLDGQAYTLTTTGMQAQRMRAAKEAA
jgi:hypothetical protein